MELCVLGGGQMGAALIGGLVAAKKIPVTEIAVYDPAPAALLAMTERFPGVVAVDAPVAADGAILAMKPAQVKDACSALAPNMYAHLLSIAAGVTLASLESWLWSDAHVVRAMPNTPSLVGAGASVIAPGSAVTNADLEWAEGILGAVGIVLRLDETALDAVTGLSGSGPAYVFYLVEAMISAGVAGGLDLDVARTLTNQTVLGAARMVNESGREAADLRAAVTSPNGTTAAAIAELERQGVKAAVNDAVACAIARSIELGKPQA